jgi:Protein of unknown function (DUF1615)
MTSFHTFPLCATHPVFGCATSRRRACALLLVFAALAILGGCATPQHPKPAEREPSDVRAQLVGLLPNNVVDREGWATDIQSAFQLLDIPPSTENLCAVLAVTEQESTFAADPAVPGLARIARQEIYRRAARFKIPEFVVNAALTLSSPNGKTYAQRLDAARTEKALSLIFEDFIGEVPLGRQLFADANPVHTAGPMQVSIAFAEQHAKDHRNPYAENDSIRHAVFTRRGGLYFGTAHLLDYPNSYERHLYRFADFNAGWYASRNAAFQAAVTAATGKPLALDGDLIAHGDDKIGATETAVRSLGRQLDMSDAAIRRGLEQGDRFEFERGDLYQKVFEFAERKQGKSLPRAVVPHITLQSPKITRRLTTEWFATRVNERYQRCVNKAFGQP